MPHVLISRLVCYVIWQQVINIVDIIKVINQSADLEIGKPTWINQVGPINSQKAP